MADDPRMDAAAPVRYRQAPSMASATPTMAPAPVQPPPHMVAAGSGFQEDIQTDSVSSRLNASAGYAVSLPRIRKGTWESVNGWLYAPDGVYFPLFITEYVTSFELAGSTAQSQMVRDFYPRNFTQPEAAVAGQSPNQHYYNRLGEFIRYFQRKSLTMAEPGRLLVPTSQPVPKGGKARISTRGTNNGFLAEGYVKNISRGGERFQFAPDFQFDFTVSNMLEGLYHEDPVKINQLRSWAEIFKDEHHVWEADPEQQTKTINAVVDAVTGTADAAVLIHGWYWIQEFLGGN